MKFVKDNRVAEKILQNCVVNWKINNMARFADATITMSATNTNAFHFYKRFTLTGFMAHRLSAPSMLRCLPAIVMVISPTVPKSRQCFCKKDIVAEISNYLLDFLCECTVKDFGYYCQSCVEFEWISFREVLGNWWFSRSVFLRFFFSKFGDLTVEKRRAWD